MDSDALVRGKPVKTATDIRDLCKRIGIPHHVLRRRSAENYLTLAALRKCAADRRGTDRQPILRAYEKLRRLQQWHYHMKEGAKKKPHLCRLFESVDPSDWMALGQGWGKGIGELFSDGSVRYADLREEGALREMAPVLRQIIALLR